MVGWNGDASTCNMDTNLAMKFGNVFADDFDELVQNDAYINHLQAMRERRGICALCKDGQNHSQVAYGGAW